MSASASFSFPPPIDWRTVAPSEWQYLSDLLPAVPPAPPSGVALRGPRSSDVTPEARAAIARVVAAAAKNRVSLHDRDDLRQELAIQLLKFASPIVNVEAWARPRARSLVADLARNDSNRRKREREYAGGIGKRYHDGPEWHPKWYPPRPEATKFDPFACKGARVMHCKGTRNYENAESAFVEYIDLVRREARRRSRAESFSGEESHHADC